MGLPLDPPSDPPLVTCPECDGTGKVPAEGVYPTTCSRCGGEGVDYLTDEEVRDAQAEAEVDRAEARDEGL